MALALSASMMAALTKVCCFFDFAVFEVSNNVTNCIFNCLFFSASNFKIIIQATVKVDIEKTTSGHTTTSGNTTITNNGDFK